MSENQVNTFLPAEQEMQSDAAMASMEATIMEQSQEISYLREQLQQAEQDRDIARQDARQAKAATAQNRETYTKCMQAVKEEKKMLAAEAEGLRAEIISLKNATVKPYMPQMLLMAAFAVLAVLIGIAADHDLISTILAEPIGYGFLCVAGIFAGVSWERWPRRTR